MCNLYLFLDILNKTEKPGLNFPVTNVETVTDEQKGKFHICLAYIAPLCLFILLFFNEYFLLVEELRQGQVYY